MIIADAALTAIDSTDRIHRVHKFDKIHEFFQQLKSMSHQRDRPFGTVVTLGAAFKKDGECASKNWGMNAKSLTHTLHRGRKRPHLLRRPTDSSVVLSYLFGAITYPQQ